MMIMKGTQKRTNMCCCIRNFYINMVNCCSYIDDLFRIKEFWQMLCETSVYFLP